LSKLHTFWGCTGLHRVASYSRSNSY
jgi:hypothetical protein